MRSLVPWFAAALLVLVILAPMALAQDATDENTSDGDKPFWIPPKSETTNMKGHTMIGEATTVGGELVDSGGPSILLPAATLLLGGGTLGYAVLRRR